jgi:hypothetical protein
MAVLDPEELFQQAEFLIKPRQPGPPLQVDVRRAISSVYYGLFHFLAAAAADEFVGKTKRREIAYALLYRSLHHGPMKAVCQQVRTKSSKFGQPLKDCAGAFIDLQERRHEADYDPRPLLRTSNALLATSAARNAVTSFELSPGDERRQFLALLAFKQRKE